MNIKPNGKADYVVAVMTINGMTVTATSSPTPKIASLFFETISIHLPDWVRNSGLRCRAPLDNFLL